MIVVDFNQTLISSLMSQIGSNPNKELSENLIRHMVLSAILSYKKKFGAEFGQLVFAADDKNYWRKDIFPYYKAGRKKMREESGFDWKLIFNTLNKIRDEIKEYFPYKVIQVDKAEADDIIATLCKHAPVKRVGLFEQEEPILIVSGDKDFLQLHKYSNVKQYSPILKKYLYTDSPEKYLKEHILKGDRGDGIPNFLCEDSRIVDGIKQTGISEKKLFVWVQQNPEDFCNEAQLRNYNRNKQLVDLTYIPENIEKQILEKFAEEPKGAKSKLFNYFVSNGLKHLMENLADF